MRALSLMLGLPDMATPQMLVLIAIIVTAAFALAWIADAILGDGGFGVFFNAVILLIGAFVGALVWKRLGYAIGTSPQATAAIVATSAGMALLLISGVLRRWV
ncbi:putative membrane protein YeaQ/YmgE (transglycosylase-associated protein family) [Bosea sp. BE125]|uniref:hypothetical protein n=1 Tax=Bosea sp. BE125 TaxID=2817909 RepID=UPI002864AC6C|nr:hypothetical protein [Bosea sp. BE125]MDR6871025.1 putative membrane protein YeaQ/YmgE (transglycosylase-associated protein family) [Bosea sp. BE125]